MPEQRERREPARRDGQVPRERLAVSIDDEVAACVSRARRAVRRFYWLSAVAVLGGTFAVDAVWGPWGVVAFLLSLYVVRNAPVVSVDAVDQLSANRSRERVREDFSGLVTPVTATWLATADEVLAPTAHDDDDVIAVLQHSRTLRASRRVAVRRTAKEDGRIVFSMDPSPSTPTVTVAIEPRGTLTAVTFDGARGPVSIWQLANLSLAGRHQDDVYRSFGYRVDESRVDLGLDFSRVFPWR